MAAKSRVKIWYDQEGDYLEVLFDDKLGHFGETSSEHVRRRTR